MGGTGAPEMSETNLNSDLCKKKKAAVPHCPICGTSRNHSKWPAKLKYIEILDGQAVGRVLEVTCGRCGYEWSEEID